MKFATSLLLGAILALTASADLVNGVAYSGDVPMVTDSSGNNVFNATVKFQNAYSDRQEWYYTVVQANMNHTAAIEPYGQYTVAACPEYDNTS